MPKFAGFRYIIGPKIWTILMKVADNGGSIKAEGLTLFFLPEKAPKVHKVAPKAPENAF